MAYMPTPWGYDVDGELPPLISMAEFSDMTGGKFDGDARAEPAVAAASAAVRSACQWHLCPSLPCRALVDGDGSASVWLPTTHLRCVSAVEVMGEEVSDFRWSRIGQVLPATRVPRTLQAATVDYEAGYDALPGDVAAIVAGAAVRAIALSFGVTSESAGGVSVSYSQAVAAVPMPRLTDEERGLLAAHRVVRSHAT
jgi:hypothetical protein